MNFNKATVWSVIRDDFMEEATKLSSYDIFSGSFILQSGIQDPNKLPEQARMPKSFEKKNKKRIN